MGLLLTLCVPLGLLAGWVLGILGWWEARRLRQEVEELRFALAAAGLPTPPAAVQGGRPWQPSVPETRPAAATPLEAAAPRSARPARGAAQAGADPLAASSPRPGPARRPPPLMPDLETTLTQRWGVWLGAAALLLAGVFLVRTAVEEGWLGPGMRCFLAALLGLALMAAAEWLRRQPPEARRFAARLPWPDQAPAALAAGGVAVLFGAAYGAAVLYALVPPLFGMLLLALAAFAGLALALAHGPLVAAIGIVGAYLTPALVETGQPFLPGLFAYLLAVTVAALLVMRQVAALWLGWLALLAAALWVLLSRVIAGPETSLWAPALFIPLAWLAHLRLLPGAVLDDPRGRRLAWLPLGALALAGLMLLPGWPGLGPILGLWLLTPLALWHAWAEPRLDRLPWLAAAAGLLALLLWTLPDWQPAQEAISIEGVVQAILPTRPWPPEALWPFLTAAAALAAMHGLGGWRLAPAAPRPLRWAALPAAVPVLVLLLAYARVRGFALDASWAAVALLLAGLLVAGARQAMQRGAPQEAGAWAAGAVAALALGAAMLLTRHWLSLTVALFLPPLAWVEARSGLRALRPVALAVAGFVLARLLLNDQVFDYPFARTPVLNGLLLAYGLPCAGFAWAARRFRRGGDDLCVAVLEGGAIALGTALVLLELHHALNGGVLSADEWRFAEQALDCSALALLATGLRRLDRWAGGQQGRRPVLRWGWRLLQGTALLLGLLLVLEAPILQPGIPVGQRPLLNILFAAYALPALLAARARRAPGLGLATRRVLGGYALLAAFCWVSLEVRRSFHPLDLSLEAAPVGDAELWAYSGAWLAFGAALLAFGIRSGARGLRHAALAVLGLTVLKVFLVDMSALVGLWRVLSFLGLGLALIALGRVYRRFVVTPPVPVPRG